MTAVPLVGIRCDATAATGLGHLSRCLGFAEALKERGCSIRFIGDYGARAGEMLATAGMDHEHHEGWNGRDIAARLPDASGVIVDGYRADENTLQQINATLPVLVIDDFARLTRYDCQAILNFTVGAPALPYPLPRARCLLGPGHLLVRRRLRTLRAQLRTLAPVGQRIVLSFGGGTWQSAARASLQALHDLAPDAEVMVVAGAGADEGVDEVLQRFRNGGQLLRGLPDLAAPFAWADTCVSGGGLTKYEAAYLGLPVAVLSGTDDESDETVQFTAAGLAIDLGRPSEVDRTRLRGSLERLLSDTGLRQQLHAATQARFPADPTANAATAWLKIVKEVRV